MPKKVFELAKELQIGPLDLVEELKKRGFSVRNHMAELSDEDVTKYLSLVNKEKAEAEQAQSEAAPKKKVVRKKATEEKKDVASDASQAPKVAKVAKVAKEDKEAATSSTDEKSPVVRKKVAVVRRKSEDKGHESESSSEMRSHQEHESSYEQETYQSESHSASNEMDETSSVGESESGEQKSGSGLRVVSRPELKESQVATTPSSSTAQDSKTDKKVYKEKVHRFTPVYIPSKDPNAPKEDEDLAASKAAAALKAKKFEDGEVEGVAGDSEDEDAKTKKRMGGLASMMTAKKAISRSQTILQSRADEELKSYMALSGSGRPIYTQIVKKRDYAGPTQQTEITEVKESKRVIHIHKGVELGEMAKKLSVKFQDLADRCLELNLLIKESDFVGPTLASEIANLFNYRVEDKAFSEEKVIAKEVVSDEQKSKYPVRPPVVAIMGHVDHGKTTLLDTLRKAKVAAGEAGGITQHIGAYSVTTSDNKKITFLDTPGHAAFASMRQRGANVTDIVILVVAADDGVMPQTKESIRFCQNSGVPVIVAVNKMDKPGVNPDRIKQELTEFNLLPEDWGGQTQYVHISALKAQGLDELLEAILLQAEIMDLRANPKGNVEAVVIESKIEQGRGPVATVLVKTGTLNKGDSIVVGETFGRARSLIDHTGKMLDDAPPSTPVQIFGLEEAPNPGEVLNVVKNEREAKKIAENRMSERKTLDQSQVKKKVASLEDFFSNAAAAGQEQKSLNLIIRADVNGSFEAIKQAVQAYSNPEVQVKVIGGGVGPITDNDVSLASTSGGFVFGFNMRPVTSARKLAEVNGVEIKNYSIIYELINDVKLAIEGMLAPTVTEEYIGRAEVKEVFNLPKIGVIAGSGVIEGKIAWGCNVRLLRNGKIVHDGKLSSLKRFKDDAKEVKAGLECGIALENCEDVKVGDIFEAYMMIEKKRKFEDVQSSEASPVL